MEGHLHRLLDSLIPIGSNHALQRTAHGDHVFSTIHVLRRHEPSLSLAALGTSMYRLVLSVASALLAACAYQNVGAAEPTPGGRARYELLGLLSDDWIIAAARQQDAGQTVERFWPRESRSGSVARFEQVLGEVCREEGIDLHFRKETDSQGFVFFYSAPLATFIAHQYTKGHLHREVLATASRGDLLRYVSGVYAREGDKQGTGIVYPQSRDKASAVGHALKTLRCSHVRLYLCDGYPGTHIITFSPGPLVGRSLGVRTAGKLPRGPGFEGCVEQTNW